MVKSKLAHLKVCDRSQRSFCFAKSFFRTREISGRSKVKPVEGLCDKHHRLWPSRSALTQNYVEGFQLFREDQIVLPLLMGEPPIGKEWMLLLIHHCQHDIKVRQSSEIIQSDWRHQVNLNWRLRQKDSAGFQNNVEFVNCNRQVSIE